MSIGVIDVPSRKELFVNRIEEQILTLQDRKQSLIDSVMPFICK